jgi:hypothetical protein
VLSGFEKYAKWTSGPDAEGILIVSDTSAPKSLRNCSHFTANPSRLFFELSFFSLLSTPRANLDRSMISTSCGGGVGLWSCEFAVMSVKLGVLRHRECGGESVEEGVCSCEVAVASLEELRVWRSCEFRALYSTGSLI